MSTVVRTLGPLYVEDSEGRTRQLTEDDLKGPATAADRGAVRLSAAPVDPLDPVALGANDPAVTNARTPTSHAASHASGGTDAISPASIGADVAGAAASARTAAEAAATTALATEATTRAGGDTTNASAIAAEATARGTAVSAEATARAAADALAVPLTQKGAAGGVGTLDGEGHQPTSQLSPSVVSSSQAGHVDIPAWAEQGLLLRTGPEGELAWGSPPVFAVKDPKYGAVGDGVHNDALALRKAFEDAEVAGGDVFLGFGQFKMTTAGSTGSAAAFGRNGKGVRVRGVGPGSEVILTAASPRLFDLKKVADYDTFRRIDIERLRVNGGGVDAKNHIVFGIRQNGTWMTKTNMEDVHVRDIEIVNSPSNSELNFGIALSACAAMSDEECKVLRCSAERISSPDGSCQQLVNVQGVPSPTGEANVWHDDILVDGVYHPMPEVPTSAKSGGHVMAGTKGRGGRITIRNVHGENSSDVGIEPSGWMRATVEDFCIQDAYDAGIYSVNYREPEDVEGQQMTLRGHVRYKNVAHGQGIKIGDANNGSAVGRPTSVNMDVTYHRTKEGACAQFEALDVYGSRRVEGRIRAVVEIGTYNSAENYAASAILIHAPDTTVRTAVDLRAKVRATGTVAGAGLINWRSLLVRDGLFTGMDIDLDSDLKLTSGGNAAVIHADMGSTSGAAEACIMSGRLRVTVPTSGGSGNTPVGIQFESAAFNAIPTEVLVHGCDMAGLAAASNDVNFAGATKLNNKVRFRDNRWRAAPQERLAVTAGVTLTGRHDLVAVTNTEAERVLTLPAANGVYPGSMFCVKDETGAASATHPIALTAAGSDTIEGAASISIVNPYGFYRYYSTGSVWRVA